MNPLDMRQKRSLSDLQLKNIIETRRETFLNLKNCIESITSNKFNRDHSGFYRWRIRSCLFITAVEMSPATYLVFILDFFGLIWGCSKRTLEFRKHHFRDYFVSSRLKEKKASNSSIVKWNRTCTGEIYRTKYVLLLQNPGKCTLPQQL